jgi:hypothetical protein
MSARLPYERCYSNWEPKFPFDMVIAYQDPATRTRAERLYASLNEQLETEYDFQSKWWGLHEFASVRLREEAADAAARADMVILALRTGQELPPEANLWIEDWLARKEERVSALVTLMHPTPHAPEEVWPVRSYLQTVARLGRMDFFFHSTETVPDLPYSLVGIRARARAITPVLEESLTPRYAQPGMGLND